MKIAKFKSIVWNLSNKGYVRHWLRWQPQKMALQFRDSSGEPDKVEGMEDYGFSWNEQLKIYTIDRD